MKFCRSSQIVDEVAIRILCDYCPRSVVDVGVVFGETAENDRVALEGSASLYQRRKILKVALTMFPGEKKGEFLMRGFDAWRKDLLTLGVLRRDVVAFGLSKDFPPCTDAEAIGFVDFAKKKGYRSTYIIAPPIHRIRAFISLVSATIKAGYDLRVYSYSTETQDWTREACFSFQTLPKGSRAKQLAYEFEKRRIYFEKGDHVSHRELLRYLDRRDMQ